MLTWLWTHETAALRHSRKPGSWDFKWDAALLAFRPNFPWKKVYLKIKNSDMWHQKIIIIRWFPQIITYFKIGSSVRAHKICSLQAFQSSVFSKEAALFLVLLLLVSYKGKCLFVQSSSPFYWPLITMCQLTKEGLNFQNMNINVVNSSGAFAFITIHYLHSVCWGFCTLVVNMYVNTSVALIAET